MEYLSTYSCIYIRTGQIRIVHEKTTPVTTINAV